MDGIDLSAAYTWAATRARGVTRRQIEADGVRLGRGLYLSTAIEPTPLTECRAWSAVLPPDAAFSHQTAAHLLGAHLDAPQRPHVMLTPRRVLPQHAELVVHSRRLQPEDVVVLHGLRVTSGPQTFLDLAAELAAAELVAVGDALMRAGHLPADLLTRRLARADRVRGVVRARACAPLLTPKAQSRPESLLRYWLVDSDLPDPTPQVEIRDRYGNAVAHGDLGYETWRVLLEYEGRQHATGDQFDRDIDRYSLAAAGGWLILKFGRRHLSGPWTVVERTRTALRSRGCPC